MILLIISLLISAWVIILILKNKYMGWEYKTPLIVICPFPVVNLLFLLIFLGKALDTHR